VRLPALRAAPSLKGGGEVLYESVVRYFSLLIWKFAAPASLAAIAISEILMGVSARRLGKGKQRIIACLAAVLLAPLPAAVVSAVLLAEPISWALIVTMLTVLLIPLFPVSLMAYWLPMALVLQYALRSEKPRWAVLLALGTGTNLVSLALYVAIALLVDAPTN